MAQTDRIKYSHTKPISPERSKIDDGDVWSYSLCRKNKLVFYLLLIITKNNW